MMVLVIGGSGSGKSAYGEERICSISGGKKKYYLAAMQVYDGEDQRRVDRHRQQRSGKGFDTIEQAVNIEDALGKMAHGEKTAMLECVSNLTANEMFSETGTVPEAVVEEKIVKGIVRLK